MTSLPATASITGGSRGTADRKHAAIRAVLHRVIISLLPPGAACNPASNIKDKAVRREREMTILRRRVKRDCVFGSRHTRAAETVVMTSPPLVRLMPLVSFHGWCFRSVAGCGAYRARSRRAP